MHIRFKKIVAREFIILVTALTIGLIMFLCTCLFNMIMQKRMENYAMQIDEKTKQAEKLSSSYKSKLSKHSWFFEKFSSNYELSSDTTFDEREEIWNSFDNWALKDSIHYRWENKWDQEQRGFLKSIGFQNPQLLKSFIETNRLTQKDSADWNTSLAFNSELLLLKSKREKIVILSYNQQIKFAKLSTIICLILFFGLRYLYYSLMWSIKTLKEKIE